MTDFYRSSKSFGSSKTERMCFYILSVFLSNLQGLEPEKGARLASDKARLRWSVAPFLQAKRDKVPEGPPQKQNDLNDNLNRSVF